MSRSGSRYPSAFGHTPSYRSYVRGGLDSGPIGYSVNLPGGSSSASYSSNLGSGLGSGLGSSGLGSSNLSSRYDSTGTTGLGSTSLMLDSEFPSLRTSGLSTDLGLGSLKDYGLGDGLSTSTSGGNVASKITKSTYSSVSDSNRGGGRPIVEVSKDTTYRNTETGPSGIPHTTYSHTTSNYNSEEPYKSRTNNYSYNV